VVVDEQHRFGVDQRLRASEKGRDPHTLVMTATPIPRTLALTLYGDLDITTIDCVPPGRTPVQTRLVDRERWDDLLRFVAGRLREGEQAFFVYPLVEESASLDLRDATRMHREIAAHPAFEGLDVGLLHGRVDAEQRERILASLHRGEMDAVVATTVVEVGLDLPRASVMVVEHPERFGLSQLHQMRGRVGRAPGLRPYFFLVRPEGESGAAERLNVLVRESNGFRIAEEDLRLRGPGQLLGVQQAGLPRMRFADLACDRSLLVDAREAAREILSSDPALTDGIHRRLWREAMRRYPDAARFFQVG
jgi:ATP-dependent DNA helicase RecG